jgi:hypothetical protein
MTKEHHSPLTHTRHGEKLLSPFEIIKTELAHNGSNDDPKKIYAAILKLVEQPKYRVLRHDNSLLLLQNKGNGAAEIYLFTADKPEKLSENFRHFAHALKIAGFKNLEYFTKRRAMIRFLKQAKVKHEESVLTNGQIHVEIEL